ncbi:MAG: hypothetical protein RQ757_11235 [Pseudomonadales bacterium]|nr:hypothetical protein [Pseudomonadales bacterium]
MLDKPGKPDKLPPRQPAVPQARLEAHPAPVQPEPINAMAPRRNQGLVLRLAVANLAEAETIPWIPCREPSLVRMAVLVQLEQVPLPGRPVIKLPGLVRDRALVEQQLQQPRLAVGQLPAGRKVEVRPGQVLSEGY